MTSLHQSAWAVELATSGQSQDWVHLLPLGSFSGRDGRGPYTVRDAADIVAASAALGMDLPVDYEHQIDYATKNGQPAPAAGWIKELKHDANGIWGRVEWTEKARQHLASKEYRFLSPVFTFHKTTGEIMRLHRAALTNNPNLHLTALASQEEPGTSEPELEPADLRGQLLRMLAMPDDTADEAVLDAIAALVKGTDTPAPETAQQRQESGSGIMEMALELNRVKAREVENKALSSVSDAITSGKLPPFMREWGLTLCRENPERFEEFTRQMVPVLTPGSQMAGRSLRQDRQELALMTGGGTGDENEILSRLGVSQDAFRKTLQREGG